MSGAAVAQMQPISMDSPQTPSSSSTTSKPASRKRQLTQAEKFSIQKFHQDNPFVTHHHIAGAFFIFSLSLETANHTYGLQGFLGLREGMNEFWLCTVRS